MVAVLLGSPLVALDGDPGMHDPSTVVVHDGRFYVYGTGTGLPISISDDGWTWRRAGTLMQALPGGGRARRARARRQQHLGAGRDSVGRQYFVYYSAPGTQPKAAIGLLVGKTLDPESPDYKWEDGGPVVWSDGVEDSNAIDPGVFRDPTNGSLWLTYGSYFGYIRLVELNPKTGKRLYPERKPVNVAINSEASIMIFRDGWYYLLVTHGSCCAGANSSYNIRMGRAKKVTGPFLDNMGIDMLQGGGKLFAGSAAATSVRDISACSISATACRSSPATTRPTSIAAASACSTSVRFSGATAGPWPATTSRKAPIRSNPRERARRSSWPCRACPVGGPAAARGPRRRGRRARRRTCRAPATRSRAGRRAGVGELAAGAVDVRMSPYMLQAQQKWTIAPVAERRRLSGIAVFQDHDRRNRSRARGTADRELVACPPSPAGRSNCGASTSSPTARIA